MSDTLGGALLESCRNPTKHRYLDRATAQMEADRIKGKKNWDQKRAERLAPYQCSCGLWHLTSSGFVTGSGGPR